MAFDAALPSNFDVAISFAGTERELAEKLAEILRAAGIAVFYDNFYPEHLWGKNSRRSWMRFIGREPNSAWCSSRRNTRNASGLFMS